MKKRLWIAPPEEFYTKSLAEAQARQDTKAKYPPKPTVIKPLKVEVKQLPQAKPVKVTPAAPNSPKTFQVGAKSSEIVPVANVVEDFPGEKNATNPEWITYLRLRVGHRKNPENWRKP